MIGKSASSIPPRAGCCGSTLRAARGWHRIEDADRPRRTPRTTLALGGGELVDQRAIHFFIEVKVKGVERAIGIAEARQLVPALEQAVLSPLQFIAHERRDEINRGHLFCLRVT
jgi:hypothetical protein